MSTPIQKKIEQKRAELRKLVYEPEHESGPTCWCGPTYFKEEDGLTHLRHKEQRDTLESFLNTALLELLAVVDDVVSDEVRKTANLYSGASAKDCGIYNIIRALEERLSSNIKEVLKVKLEK